MQETHIHHLKVDPSGRIALPASLRSNQRIEIGDVVLAVADAEGLHIRTRAQALSDAQSYFATLAPKKVMMSEEILSDRRSETERD